MGSDPARDRHAKAKEQPQHSVYLPEYYIGRYPVTNAQYRTFVALTNHNAPKGWEKGKPLSGRQDHPVVNVSWRDAIAFCKWLSQESGKSFRLPSEAEWEKAARGVDGRVFPWGDNWDPTKLNCEGKYRGDTAPVGASSPASDSLYRVSDMSGNTFEFCSSMYKKYPYKAKDGREELTLSVRRVLRSGPSNTDAWCDVLRCAVRHSTSIDKPSKLCGFRVAASPW